MTRAEWDALSARERDAIVAEKVMGWRFVSDHAELAAINGHNGDPERWHIKGEWHSERGREACVECGNLPDFTTTPDGMMAVIGKMRGAGWFVEVTHRPHAYNDVEVVLCQGFVNRMPTPPQHYACAQAATEAVCLAALTANGEMEP